MTILNSITLSNVRRFATNQTIEFGKGATILLAPNGTGKTTIFEAIELALTGGVNRLKNTLLPLVRDTATSATAILTFDDWVRSVSLDSKGNVKINEKGQLLRIFKDAAPSDWAHLLRLTHLLDQRDRDWFVQQGNSEAGQQLDRLPMGKDAAKVSAVLTSAKIGMTKEADAAKIKLEAAQKVLKEWQRLLVERDMAYKDGVQALIPLVDIAAHLGRLSPDTVTANVATPEALQSLRADLAITNGQKLKGYELKIAEFLAENNLPNDFGNVKIALVNAQLLLTQADTEQQRINAEHTKAIAVLDAAEKLTAEKLRAKNAVVEQVHKMNAVVSAKIGLNSKQQELSQLNLALSGLKSAIAPLSERAVEDQRIEAMYHSFEAKAKQAVEMEKKIQIAQQKLLEWTDNLRQQNELTTTTQSAKRLLDECQKRYQAKITQLESYSLTLQLAEGNLKTVGATTDTIRAAVSAIASQLRPDQGDCPVCLANYEAKELHDRIKQVLANMNPTIAAASEQVQLAKTVVQAAAEEKLGIESELNTAQRQLMQYEVRNVELNSALEQIKAIELLRNLDLGTADEVLTSKMAELQVARTLLDKDIASAAPRRTADELEKSKENLNIKESELQALNSKQALVAEECQQMQLKVAVAEANCVNQPPLEVLNVQQAEIEAELVKANSHQGELRQAIVNWSNRLTSADEAKQRAANNVQAEMNRVQNLQAKWQALALAGEPNATVLDAAKQRTEALRTEVHNKQNELAGIENTLAHWLSAKTYRSKLDQIDSQRGQKSELEFTIDLKKILDTEKTKEAQIIERRETLETFSKKLQNETDNMKEYVKTVGPYWQNLLARLVREPRFADSNLNYELSRNKPQAGIQVPLGKGTAILADIASEAQMTDCQLSFMLAMALVHSWSPWKALLLDDPTQHHDLVHAAAVFDLLRDYIVDYGFQVVVATHDVVQARFFLRKLQNDGIDARLWGLTPGSDGVEVRELTRTVHGQ